MRRDFSLFQFSELVIILWELTGDLLNINIEYLFILEKEEMVEDRYLFPFVSADVFTNEFEQTIRKGLREELRTQPSFRL